MVRLINKSLTLKLVFALAAILIVAFTLLCYLIIGKQNNLLGSLAATVHEKLDLTDSQTQQSFASLEQNVATTLGKMGEQATQQLAQKTEKSLTAEETNIQDAMEKLLTSNAQAVGTLLANIAAEPFMAKRI